MSTNLPTGEDLARDFRDVIAWQRQKLAAPALSSSECDRVAGFLGMLEGDERATTHQEWLSKLKREHLDEQRQRVMDEAFYDSCGFWTDCED